MLSFGDNRTEVSLGNSDKAWVAVDAAVTHPSELRVSGASQVERKIDQSFS
jgi:hypothetical protein